MKKLIMTVAVLGCAAAVTAQTVTSANIVGYKKNVQPAGGFSIIAPAQFGGTAGGITISDAVSGVVGGEKVYIYDGTSYAIYTFFAGGYGWLDGLFQPAGGVVIPEGSAVWMEGPGSFETITAGEVPSAASVNVAVVAGFNLISNPYPVALALADIDVTAFGGGEKVYIFDGTAYAIYTFFAGGYGWLDGLFQPAGSVQVPVGEGFWLEMGGSTTLVFNKLF